MLEPEPAVIATVFPKRGPPIMFRRTLLSSLAALAIVALGATSVLAASPHIVGSPTATVSGNTLTVTASVAGLGSVTSVDLTLSGTIDVNSRCYTRSGNKPQAANKQETITVDSTGTFPVRNGRTNATFTVSPVSTLSCPPGQRVVIESFSYDLSIDYLGESLGTFSG
jgi:hypothetical protein